MSSLANFPKALAIFQDKKLAKIFFQFWLIYAVLLIKDFNSKY